MKDTQHILNSSESGECNDIDFTDGATQGRETIPRVVQIAIYLNLFVMYFLFRSPFDFYIGYFFVFTLLPFFIVRYGIPKHIALIFLVLMLSALAQVLLSNNTLFDFLKVFIGTVTSYLFFYYVVIAMDLNLKGLFTIYLKGSLFSASIALFQMLSYLIGFEAGYDLSWIHRTFTPVPGGLFGIRVGALFGEPTYLAMFTSGAVFVAIHDFLYPKRSFYFSRLKAALMIIGVYASFSGTLVGTMVLSVILLGINYGFMRYLLIGFPLATILLILVVTRTDDFQQRYSGTLGLFLDAPSEEFNVFQYHGSSVVLYNNFFIAKENFKRHPLFGTGMGSHAIATDKFSLTKNIKTKGFSLNTRDANSMFNRLMSETGLFGLGVFVFILLSFFVRRPSDDQDEEVFWLISSACLVVILINMLRQGHYFLNGFPFYVWVFIRAYKESTNQRVGLRSSS